MNEACGSVSMFVRDAEPLSTRGPVRLPSSIASGAVRGDKIPLRQDS